MDNRDLPVTKEAPETQVLLDQLDRLELQDPLDQLDKKDRQD
jgi:hypothetical protein